MFGTYWLLWISLFPSVPFWSPHGALMTLIVVAAAIVLILKYFWNLLHRT
jgi:hypothetical protein